MNSSGQKTGTSVPGGKSKSMADASKKMYQMKSGGKPSGAMSTASGMSKSKAGLAKSLVDCCKKKYKGQD